MTVAIFATLKGGSTSADHTARLRTRPEKEDVVAVLVRAHATLTVIGSAWDAVPGQHRLRLLQQAHALEPVVSQYWPKGRKGNSRRLLDQPGAAVWLGAEKETRAAIGMETGGGVP
ncbi:MAG TPA: hypothetical protein VHA37_07765 [Candidatus Saccharimonadales bacterium]|nr:hypothetical protein [Candidatus Saccharimonadales bacterium]